MTKDKPVKEFICSNRITFKFVDSNTNRHVLMDMRSKLKNNKNKVKIKRQDNLYLLYQSLTPKK